MAEASKAVAVAETSQKPSLGFRRIVKGAIWNWGEFLIGGVVAFFLSPFVVHHLGNTAYGVWVLIGSVISYMGLLDLGMRGAVIRFVSADQPRGLHEEASQAVSAALWFRFWLAAVILVATISISSIAPHAFHIPAEMQAPARWAILLVGLNLAIALSLSVFSGVLSAIHRFDLISSITAGQSILNAAGLVFLLGRGHGIVAMAAWQLLLGVLAGAAQLILAFRIYPQLRLVLRIPDKQLIRKFWSYSFFLFIIAISGQVIYYTDNIVIGAALPVSAVALYAIGCAPTQYLRQIISSLAITFMPAASNLDVRGDYTQLRRLLIHGTRAVLLVALPIEAALLTRGHTFIRLWMGSQYADSSGRVLQVLVLAWLFISANCCSGNIVYGLSKHKAVAQWTIGEALANLCLSIYLVQRIGILGVAWGTTLPSLVVHGFLWPRYTAKVVDIPLSEYLWQAWGRPALCVVPFAVVCFLSEKVWPADHLWFFFLQIVVVLPVFMLTVVLMFRTEVVRQVKLRLEAGF
jgi:O-antigen/teichoic acid export membrane protein